MKDETFLEIKEALAKTGCTYLDSKDYWYLVGKIEELEEQLSISQVDLKAALVRERKLKAQVAEIATDRLEFLKRAEAAEAQLERVRRLAREALRQDKQVTHYQIIEALEEVSDE